MQDDDDDDDKVTDMCIDFGRGITLTLEGTGTRRWRTDGLLHCVHGPAVVYPDGEENWYLYGAGTRHGGPAVTQKNGTKIWMVNDMCHNENGAAVQRKGADGKVVKSYWLNGMLLSKEEHDAATKKLKSGSPPNPPWGNDIEGEGNER